MFLMKMADWLTSSASKFDINQMPKHNKPASKGWFTWIINIKNW